MTNYKSGDPEKKCNDRWDVVIGWIGGFLHHLRSMCHRVNILCTFVYRIWYFYAQVRGTILLQVMSLTYLSLWENVANYIHGTKS